MIGELPCLAPTGNLRDQSIFPARRAGIRYEHRRLGRSSLLTRWGQSPRTVKGTAPIGSDKVRFVFGNGEGRDNLPKEFYDVLQMMGNSYAVRSAKRVCEILRHRLISLLPSESPPYAAGTPLALSTNSMWADRWYCAEHL